VIIKDGEENKNFETYRFITEALLQKKIERKDTIIAFGGGVTGDLTGFAAATVLRGVKLIQIPTTLLAQVDSSIGGKTGLNTKYGKNLIGSFYQPNLVLIDPDVLNTLGEPEIKTGLGEIIKYAFIERDCSENNDYYLYNYLFDIQKKEFMKNIEEIIYRSMALKTEVVSRDEKEEDLRTVLNFGHTFAHAIEALTDYKKYTHGQAVVMGIKSAFELSLNMGFIEKDYYNSANTLIDKFSLIQNHKIQCDKNDFINVMKSDKKVISSKIRLVLPVDTGKVRVFADINEKDIKRVI
ncbi:MAG: 3-dehydroquinate synthase, partial [Candidatus Gastranaerophilales bacterium]|nr:3-dehydroquinate synthase [Candidatus Gastranaerophilales bacterium]